MAINGQFGPQARGDDQPEWSIDEVELAIGQQIKTYNRQLDDGGPQFSVARDPVDQSLDVQVNGESILIVLPDDATPGEFVLLKPYAFKDPPLGGGQPDQRFFGEVRSILKDSIRGELMPGFDLKDEDDEPGGAGDDHDIDPPPLSDDDMRRIFGL